MTGVQTCALPISFVAGREDRIAHCFVLSRIFLYAVKIFCFVAFLLGFVSDVSDCVSHVLGVND